MTAEVKTNRGFTLTRLLNAPRELVFQAWTDPDHLQWFFNPLTTPTSERAEVDLRVGGAWRLRMIENEQKQYITGGIYREIVPVERLVFQWGAVDGWPEIDATRNEPGLVVTVELSAKDEKTEMTVSLDFPDSLSDEDVRALLDMGMSHGWGDTIDRLVAVFASRK